VTDSVTMRMYDVAIPLKYGNISESHKHTAIPSCYDMWLSSFITYHVVCSASNITGATNETETAHPSISASPVFRGIRVS
jgi:hypothetical protein